MKKLIISVFLLLTPVYILGHSLVLNVVDNQDDTMTVEGMFNTGESAAGALVKIQAIGSEKIIFQQRLSDTKELTVKIPTIPYMIILDGGEGHTVEQIGIPPRNGFEEVVNVKKKKKPSKTTMSFSSSYAVTISIIFGFILLFATIFISIKNTNKLLSELKK